LKRALLVIDAQNEYFSGRLPVTYPKECFHNILKAVDFAVRQGMPIVIIQHTGQGDSETFRKDSHEWKLHAEIAGRPYSHHIEKHLPGSFAGTDLEAYLRKQAIDTVVISGYMTQMCCDTTARQAFHLGFAVEFLSDATGTLDISNYAGKVTAEELHRSILGTQAMRVSRVMSADEWIRAASFLPM
jgi:nicotinamidase-related amidase